MRELRNRPFVVLRIKPGTPLYEARLPIDKKEQPDGTLLVRLDPVSYSAMLASLGRFFPLEKIIEELEAINLQAQGSQAEEEEFDNSIPEDDQIPEEEFFEEDDALQLPD